MWTSTFWKAAAERAIKTFAQTATALLIGSDAGIVEIDWVHIASVSAVAAVASVLTSIASGVVTNGSASLVAPNQEDLP